MKTEENPTSRQNRNCTVTCLRAACALWLAVSAGPALAADYEWTFHNGDLSAALGPGIMTYADTQTPTLATFGTTDGTTVPNIGGLPASYLHFPQLPSPANGFNLEFTATGPNGGGAYVNQYTFVMDLLSPGSMNWTALFNTDPSNGNDADFYVAPDGSVGIGALGYSSAGLINAGTWYRIAFAVGAGGTAYYVNGNPVFSGSAPPVDGRFSLYSNLDPGADLRLFNEGDASGNYTHELYVNGVYFADRPLSAAEIGALGGPNALGIVVVPEPGAWALVGLGALALGAWRRAKKR
jgi:hypothetical protein